MTLRIPLLLALLALSTASQTALADDKAMLACRKLTDGAARLACYDAIPAAAPAAAQSFGLEPKKPEESVQSIQSTIVGNVSGWGPATQFTLANGQVWKVVDGSQTDFAPIGNARIKIERGMFGAMFLEIEGINTSPKVRRVR